MGECIDAYVTIGSYVLCVSTHYLRTCNCLQVKKMLIMYESAHDLFSITRNEFYHNTHPNDFACLQKVQFSKSVFGTISMILPICIMKKINLKISCKWNHSGFWNLCKCLQNFVNVAALIRI